MKRRTGTVVLTALHETQCSRLEVRMTVNRRDGLLEWL